MKIWVAAVFLGVTAALTVGLFLAPPKPVPVVWAHPACRNFYTRMFGKPSLEVRIVFGYKDARPARFVADRYEMALLLQRLTAPCAAGREDCGFRWVFRGDADEPEQYSKMVRGPDGNPHRVNLRVQQSSSGADDLTNRANPFQKWQSEAARTAFLEGIRTADVVFYDGHSRLGGGPDFTPPRLTSDDHVDYAHYQSRQPGLANFLQALKESSRLSVLGLFSCSSTQHFAKKIERSRPGLRLFASEKSLYFSEALDEALGALNELLRMNCAVMSP